MRKKEHLMCDVNEPQCEMVSFEILPDDAARLDALCDFYRRLNATQANGDPFPTTREGVAWLIVHRMLSGRKTPFESEIAALETYDATQSLGPPPTRHI